LTQQGRRRKVAKLRAKGLSFEEIGRRVGVSKQRVAQLLHSIAAISFDLRCHDCGVKIAAGLKRAARNAPPLCPACLTRTPGASIGERLKAYRLGVGLTQRLVATQAGITPQALAQFEQSTCQPTPATLERLVAVFGPDLARGLFSGRRGQIAAR